MVDGLISTTKPGHRDGYMDQNSCQSAVMHYYEEDCMLGTSHWQ